MTTVTIKIDKELALQAIKSLNHHSKVVTKLSNIGFPDEEYRERAKIVVEKNNSLVKAIEGQLQTEQNQKE